MKPRLLAHKGASAVCDNRVLLFVITERNSIGLISFTSALVLLLLLHYSCYSTTTATAAAAATTTTNTTTTFMYCLTDLGNVG